MGGDFKLKKYVKPEIEMIVMLSTDTVLTASEDEVFVDGGDLFGE